MLNKRLVAGTVITLGACLTLATASYSQPPAGAGRGAAPGATAPGRGPGAQAPGRGGAGRGPAAAPTPPRVAAGPIVRVRGGQVQGYLDNGVFNYMGIPYAAPPIGDLRWKAPQPVAAWTGVKTATAPGASCANGENCLFLNVHTPEGFKPGDKLPVMMWIYGGAFTGGAGDSGFGVSHDGGNFARKGVVVVTINYRLGRAGWFSHPALSKEPGLHNNYGVMDQIAGLKWIRDNIAQFGGNPNNVTVFGESAGAMSTLNLMVTPEGRGLFHKAISESGFPRFVPTPLATAEAYGVRVQQANNITGSDAQVAAALRRLPLSAFPAAAGSDDPARPILIADGKLVLDMTMAQAFEQNREAHIPLIIGGNSADLYGITPTAAMWDAVTDRRPALMAAYSPGRNNDKTMMMSDLLTDQRMGEPNRAVARAHAKNGSPAYLYYFSYVPAAQRATSAGARHLAEVQYVFGTGRMDQQGFSTSQSMNSYWAGFAKYGNPAGAGGPVWPKYDAANEPTLEFAYTGSRVVNHNLQARQDYVLAGIPK